MKKCISILCVLPLLGCATPVPDDTAFSSVPVGAGRSSTSGEANISMESLPDGSDQGAVASGDATFLGFTVASLGDASRPGLWLETPLVDVETPGNVISERGLVLEVILRPSGGERGAGSRLSLEGFQTLGIDLTTLPTLTVNAYGTGV